MTLYPLASKPLAGRPDLIAIVQASLGSFLLGGQSIGLSYSAHRALPGVFVLTGQSIQTIISVGPASLNAIVLTGVLATKRHGVNMIKNFEMTAGDTKQLIITVKDANDSPVNISGATIEWKCARSLNKPTKIYKTTSSGITITNGPNGTFAVTLNAGDSSNLLGNYIHEARMTLSGNISTVISGTMKVNKPMDEATAT